MADDEPFSVQVGMPGPRVGPARPRMTSFRISKKKTSFRVTADSANPDGWIFFSLKIKDG
jgi:hypothetical protein